MSCISTIVLMAFMPFGSWIAKSVSKDSFDKITLILLGFIALRIIYLNFLIINYLYLFPQTNFPFFGVQLYCSIFKLFFDIE